MPKRTPISPAMTATVPISKGHQITVTLKLHPSPKISPIGSKECSASSPSLASLGVTDTVRLSYRATIIGSCRTVVDKVVIAQDSLQRFVNTMSPGAYASVTKVDFKTLDRLMIKPLGVYGSKDVIVRLLTSIGAIDEEG
jgi:hypothetical protein